MANGINKISNVRYCKQCEKFLSLKINTKIQYWDWEMAYQLRVYYSNKWTRTWKGKSGVDLPGTLGLGWVDRDKINWTCVYTSINTN